MRRAILWLCLFLAAGSRAALPEGSIVIEAEKLSVTNNAWRVKDDFRNWYGGRPSGGKFLAGDSGTLGDAEISFDLPKAGTYKLWVRYLDLARYRGCTFKAAILQGEQTLAEKEFDQLSLRTDEAGRKKWGDGFAMFVWDSIEFAAEAGAALLRISKGQAKAGTGSGSRHLDVFVITPDLTFEPQINDLYPLFAKIKMLPEQKDAVAIHIFGRRSMRPWYTPHLNINRQGIFVGANNGAKDLKGGDASPWVEISKYLSYHGNDNLLFYAMQNYHAKPLPEAAFEVYFSRIPDDSGIFKSAARSGSGNGMLVSINLYKNAVILTDEEGSRTSLQYALATKPVQGGYPQEFPFITGLSLDPANIAPAVIERELQALKHIGITGLNRHFPQTVEMQFPWYMGGNFYFHFVKNRCLSQPDHARIEAHMKRFAETSGKDEELPWFMLNMMDEPGLEMQHVMDCPVCAEGFAAYLKKQGQSISGKPTNDHSAGALYYWSLRYRNHIMAEMLRSGTEAAHKFMPDIPTTVNFATEIVYDGNMVSRGCDWFEILGTGALTMGWHEDWANNTATYQIAGFQSDVMRAACRPRGIPYGIYNILARHPWDIVAKGFVELGHGNQAMYFFSYGPSYALSSDSNSHRPEIYQAIKEITYAAGLVDEPLREAKVAPADAAMLFSVTSDIWNDGKDNVFGKERIFLSLLLTHCNYRLEILSEDDLANELNKYKVLFVTDSHLRKSQLVPLISWVKAGGVLYLGAGALEFDEANQLLGLDKQIGLERQPLQMAAAPGRAEYEMVRLKNLQEGAKPAVLAGWQAPRDQDIRVGQGRVIFSGFFPGISYIGTSTQEKEQEIYSVRDFLPEYRDYISALDLPVTPRLTTDNYRIEANLLESPNADVLVLSNWTGEPQTVKLTLNNPPAYRQIECSTEILQKEQTGNQLHVTLKMAAGAFVKCEK